jgi:hypothetical protein
MITMKTKKTELWGSISNIREKVRGKITTARDRDDMFDPEVETHSC